MSKTSNKTAKGKEKPLKRFDQVITTHINADFDALSSMIAARKLYPEAALVFPGAQEKNLRNFFLHSTSYLLNFTKLKDIDLSAVKKLVLVDTRQKSRIGKFAELVGKKDVEIHVYDHHPESSEDVKGTIQVIREIGSNTALLTRIIREKGIPLSEDEATIMALGIHEDTGSFTFSSTTAEDYEAAAWLTTKGAKHNVISDMLTRELTAEQIWLLNDLIQSAVTKNINGIEVVITKAIRDEYIGDLAVLVHKFMEMENLKVVFALAQMEDRVYLVARSRIDEVNVADITMALGGGGHPQAASATIKNRTLNQIDRSLLALLRNRITPANKAKDMMSSPVIWISPQETVKKAADLMTRYNINVLMVIEQDGRLMGYITRQIVEKAAFYQLEDIKVKEYTNIEFSTVHPETSLKEIQGLIINEKLRILPVVKDQKVLGVITRTDLLNILVGGQVVPEFLGGTNSKLERGKKNMSSLIKQRLPKRVISIFRDLGRVADDLGYNAYLVGGIVRDMILNRENLDIDIVIEGDGIAFALEFGKQHGVRVNTHRKFGTAVIIFPGDFKVDIATARMEYYEAPGTPPKVETSSLKLDLYRRDFTINTLAVSLNKKSYGTLVDYFGGQKDIKEKVIRVLHNLSFVEDPTRVLRAIRFEQRFGFKIGKLTQELIRNAIKIDCFKDLSGRRLFLELKLILEEQEPIRAIERMAELELLQIISPKIGLTKDLEDLLEEIDKIIGWYNLLYLQEPFEQWRVYWNGLTTDLDNQSLRALAQKLGLIDRQSRKMLSQRENVRRLLDELYKFDSDNYELYTLLEPCDTETLLYMMARAKSEKARKLISTYFTKLKGTRVELTGKDLLQMGFKPGPIFKDIFEGLLKARLNGKVKTKEDEIKLIKSDGGLTNNPHLREKRA